MWLVLVWLWLGRMRSTTAGTSASIGTLVFGIAGRGLRVVPSGVAGIHEIDRLVDSAKVFALIKKIARGSGRTSGTVIIKKERVCKIDCFPKWQTHILLYIYIYIYIYDRNTHLLEDTALRILRVTSVRASSSCKKAAAVLNPVLFRWAPLPRANSCVACCACQEGSNSPLRRSSSYSLYSE